MLTDRSVNELASPHEELRGTDPRGRVAMTAVRPPVLPVPSREAVLVQALSGLEPVHYREAFAIAVDGERAPEAWARLLLEGASARRRTQMRRTWTALGLALGPPDGPGYVLGWRVERQDADAVVLAVDARSGFSARIVLAVRRRRLVHTMVVRYDRWYARPLWGAIAPRHRAFVRGLLADLAVRVTTDVGIDEGRQAVRWAR